MYNATEINYKIEGRVQNQLFTAAAFKLREGGLQVYVKIAGEGKLFGKVDSDDIYGTLVEKVNEAFGEEVL